MERNNNLHLAGLFVQLKCFLINKSEEGEMSVPGMCSGAYVLFAHQEIPEEDALLMVDYIQKNAPLKVRLSCFFNKIIGDAHYADSIDNVLFWKSNLLEPRVKWMDKHIHKLIKNC